MSRMFAKQLRRVVASFTLAAMMAAILPIHALAAASPGERLSEAQELFDLPEWDGALQITDEVLENPALSGDVRFEAHLLRARCLLALDREGEAQAAFCEVLKLKPEFRMGGARFKKEEQEAFSRAIAVCLPTAPNREPLPDPRGGGGKKLLFAGAAVVAGGILWWISTMGGEDDPVPILPEFPDPPTN